MSASRTIDSEVADTLRQMRRMARSSTAVSNRSLRPGRNTLRRMNTGELVGAYRQEIVERRIHGVEDTRWEALSTELERRELREAAEEARRDDPAENRDATTTMGTMAAGVIAGSVVAGAYRETSRIENAVNDRAEELGSEDLPVDQLRETSPLTHSEYSADLEEVGADEQTLEAADYSAVINGENPEEAMLPHHEEVESELVSSAVLEEIVEAEDSSAAEL